MYQRKNQIKKSQGTNIRKKEQTNKQTKMERKKESEQAILRKEIGTINRKQEN